MDLKFNTVSTPLPPHTVPEPEAKFYYAGLPSSPSLVYRTSTTPWEEPTGPEAYLVLKELVPVFCHRIADIWDTLGPKVCDCLDSKHVMWTSIDVVRFRVAKVGETPGPIVLWIGVIPQSLSGMDAHTAALACLELLASFQLTDVEVEFRESLFTQSAGYKLMKSVPSLNPISDVSGPLTPALGLPIAQVKSHSEGTGGVYISAGEGHENKKIWILTAHHVVFPENAGPNELYHYKLTSQPHFEVILPGPKAFQAMLQSTMVRIGEHKTMVDFYNQQLEDMHSGHDENEEHAKEIKNELKKAEAAIIALNQFHDEATKNWSEESLCVIGHVAYSPPLTMGTGAEQYTEDWALIELDLNKIDWDNFRGNVVDLGTKIPVHTFISRMHPKASVDTTFRYPSDRLLPLQGIIGKDELRSPKTVDASDEPCLPVIKSGCSTGVTIGRATGISSFVRRHFHNGPHQTSKEWAILPYDRNSGAFSSTGDSGSVIFDGQGRIGGLLTGGAGLTEAIDITYGTPFYWIMERIKEHFPHASLYQATS